MFQESKNIDQLDIGVYYVAQVDRIRSREYSRVWLNQVVVLLPGLIAKMMPQQVVVGELGVLSAA